MLKAIVYKVSDTAKKVWYYRNIVLFAEFFLAYKDLREKDFSLHFLKTQSPCRGVTPDVEVEAMEKLTRYVCVFLSAAKAIGGLNTCYMRALLLAAYLSRKGIPATLHFSAGSRDGVISGHAHLETQGKNIFGPVDDFQPLFFFPENENYEKTGNTV